jgi:hypothetical protein
MIADIVLGALLAIGALLCFIAGLASAVFVPDGQAANPAWKGWLTVALLLAVFAYLCFADAHVAHSAELATALLPIHLERAKMCAETYSADAVPHWITPGMCRAFLGDDGVETVVTFEGTRPDFAGDWLVDLNQAPLDLDPSLGRLPHGFGTAVFSVVLRIMRELGGHHTVGFNGHSMGGSNALIAAAAWKLAGHALGRVTAFEPARVGKLGRVLAGEQVLITSCGSDPVPAQPFWREHPVEPVHLEPSDRMSPIDCHEIDNVAAAIDAALRAPVRA